MSDKKDTSAPRDDIAGAPLFSVIIPAFNRESYIGGAIRSCLRQERIGAVEVIVVDDGSTDDTPRIAAATGDPRVVLVRHECNRGAAAARNTGIERSRGRYVAFLDSDDVWDPDKLCSQLELIERAGDGRTLVCHCQTRARQGAYQAVLPSRGLEAGESVAEYLFVHEGHIQTSTLVLPRELAMEARFDEMLRKHQDYDFCLRLEKAGARFQMVPRPLLTWYHDDRPDRITHRYGVEASEHFLQTRRQWMGPAAANAFWVRHVLPYRLRADPLWGMLAFARQLLFGPLPATWYLRWLKTGLKRSLRRSVAHSAGPRP